MCTWIVLLTLIPNASLQTIYKFGRDGMGKLISLSQLDQCQTLALGGWTQEMVRSALIYLLYLQTYLISSQIVHWCALAGCDYQPSLPKLGIVTAYKIVRQASKERGGRSLVWSPP